MRLIGYIVSTGKGHCDDFVRDILLPKAVKNMTQPAAQPEIKTLFAAITS